MSDANALPPSWPSPRTDPPDDDLEGIEAAADAEHEGWGPKRETCWIVLWESGGLASDRVFRSRESAQRAADAMSYETLLVDMELIPTPEQHDCDGTASGGQCVGCVACYLARNMTVCQFTCEHRGDLE